MPHVVIKLWPGQEEATKQKLADSICQDVVEIIGCPEGVVSIAIEEVAKDRWHDDVEVPEVLNKMETMYKKPNH